MHWQIAGIQIEFSHLAKAFILHSQGKSQAIYYTGANNTS